MNGDDGGDGELGLRAVKSWTSSRIPPDVLPLRATVGNDCEIC